MYNKGKTGAGIFLVCYIAYTSIYIARLNLSMATPQMLEKNTISASQIGLLNRVFFVVYAIGRLISGEIGDRLSPAVMISAGLAACGISNVLFGFFPPFAALIIFWAMNAFSQSMLWSSVLCSLVGAYGSEKARKMTPYMVTSVAFGNVAGILLNTGLINSFGTAFAFVVPGVITIIMSVIGFAVLRNISTPQPETNENHLSLIKLLKEGTVRNSFFAALAQGVIKDNITAWMTVYFADTFGINLSKISGFVLFIPIVGLIGRLAYPIIYNVCNENEHKVSLLGFLISIFACAVLLIQKSSPVISIIALSLIYTAVSLINTSLLSVFPMGFVKTGNVASVSGLMDFATYFGAGISSVIFGYALAGLGYGFMFAFWAVISAFALIPITILIKTKSKEG